MKIKFEGNKSMFSGLANQYKELVEEEIFATTEAIADGARAKAPVNDGFLRNSIITQTSGLEGEVIVGAHYGPYVEFGTGARVNVPSGLEAYANSFKGRKGGGWKEFEASMRDWLRKKGIEEKALYPIMASIWRNGIYPSPFLYPSFFKEVNEMMNRLERAINGKNGTKSVA